MKLWLRICYLIIGLLIIISPIFSYIELKNELSKSTYLQSELANLEASQPFEMLKYGIFGVIYLLFGLGIFKMNKASNISLFFGFIYMVIFAWGYSGSMDYIRAAVLALPAIIIQYIAAIILAIGLALAIRERFFQKTN